MYRFVFEKFVGRSTYFKEGDCKLLTCRMEQIMLSFTLTLASINSFNDLSIVIKTHLSIKMYIKFGPYDHQRISWLH